MNVHSVAERERQINTEDTERPREIQKEREKMPMTPMGRQILLNLAYTEYICHINNNNKNKTKKKKKEDSTLGERRYRN